MALKDTVKALKGDGSGQVSGPKNQRGTLKGKLYSKLANEIVKQGTGIAKDIASGEKTVQNGELVNANTTEQTIGGYNYSLPGNQQGQLNALNGTGHVAGIQQPQLGQLQPVEGEQIVEVQPETMEEQPATTTQQVTIQPTVSGGNKIVAVSPEVVQAEPAEDIVNWSIPENWQNKNETVASSVNEQAIANMENDLLKSTEGMLYGKVTAANNGSNGIHTSADPYNAQVATNQARIANLRKLQGIDSKDIADSIVGGDGVPYGEQALSDLMQYNPEKYAEVQRYIKQAKGQEAINGITSGNMSSLSSDELTVENINKGVNNRADSISSNAQQAGQFITNITNAISNNGAANSAKQEMLNISEQVEDIKEKLANVKKEAAASFKGDVPQYMVDARAANLAQQYQSQLNKLEGRFNTAADIYKTELSHAEWEQEMQLKYAQRQDNLDSELWNRYYKELQLKQDSVKRVNGNAYQLDLTTGTYRQITNDTAKYSYISDVNDMLQGWTSIYQDGGRYGKQCEAFTDNFTEATTGIRMTGQRSDGATTAEEKWSYVNTLTPEVGSVVVAIGGAYDSIWGHTMLITGYDETTGLMNLMWANTDGDLRIHTSTKTLADIQRNATRVGIRNPYQDMVEQSIAEGGTGSYYYYANPMQQYFEQAYENATVASERADIAAAQDSYAIMYELAEGGYLDLLANSDEFNTLISQISSGKFTDSDGNIMFDAIGQYARNKLKSEDIAYAIDRFHRLIEKKLRKESGAAINQSEWNSNFDMYLPAVGQSPEYRYKKIAALENDIVAAQLPPKYRANYIPAFNNTVTREIR